MRRLRPLIAFGGSSAVGLLTDLATFTLMTALGVPPALSNIVSSLLAMTVVYLVATRHVFGVGRRWTTYVLFCAWYGAMILATSVVVEWVVKDGWIPLAAKLATVPFSFCLNFAFSRALFRRRKPTTPTA